MNSEGNLGNKDIIDLTDSSGKTGVSKAQIENDLSELGPDISPRDHLLMAIGEAGGTIPTQDELAAERPITESRITGETVPSSADSDDSGGGVARTAAGEALEMGDSAIQGLEEVDIPDIDLEAARQQFGNVPLDLDTGMSRSELSPVDPATKAERLANDAYRQQRADFHDAPLPEDPAA